MELMSAVSVVSRNYRSAYSIASYVLEIIQAPINVLYIHQWYS